MRKIIYWHENFYPTKGGGQVHIENLISNFDKDYHPKVVTNYVKNCSSVEMFSRNCMIRRFPRKSLCAGTNFLEVKVISYPIRLLNDLQGLKSKIGFIKNSNFDLLHVHGVSFYKEILRLNKLLSLNIYQKVVDFSFVKQPKLLTLHNLFPEFTNDRITVDAYNHYIAQFENIISVDKHIYEYCVQYCKEKGYKKKIWFIPNSIDTKKFYYAQPQIEGNLTIGFVGRLAGTLDLTMINQLIAELPREMEFYMAVTGDLKLIKIPRSIEDRVKIFIGVRQSKMPEFYRNTGILFNPVLHKGITRVTLEAMACGRPVIMYDIGNRYPVLHGKTGYLVKRSMNDIFDVLRHVHKNQKELRTIGLNAREAIENKYSNDVVIPKIKKIYEYIMNES